MTDVTDPMPDRQCGGCVVCCYTTAVPELNKPVNVWCPHCDVGVGCTIYEQRPVACRDFECLWLKSPWMDDELRPDKCGVMFEPIAGKRTVVATVDPARHEAGQNPAVRGVIDNLIVSGRPVIMTSEGHPEPLTILPDGWTYEEAWNGAKGVTTSR